MLLDLSELFVCPRCRPTQGLVVLVDEIRDRRVVRGHLGCPSCEARYPVERGTLRFDAPAGGGPAAERAVAPAGPGPARGGSGAPGGAALFLGASAGEAALRLAALLGLPEADGPFLVHRALAGLAADLAEAAEGEEVLALAEAAEPAGTDAEAGGAEGGGRDGGEVGGDSRGRPNAGRRVTRIVGAPIIDLPVFSGRLGGAALLDEAAEPVEEAVRTLREGARLVVLEPRASLRDAVDGLPVEVIAADSRALVAVRRA